MYIHLCTWAWYVCATCNMAYVQHVIWNVYAICKCKMWYLPPHINTFLCRIYIHIIYIHTHTHMYTCIYYTCKTQVCKRDLTRCAAGYAACANACILSYYILGMCVFIIYLRYLDIWSYIYISKIYLSTVYMLYSKDTHTCIHTY